MKVQLLDLVRQWELIRTEAMAAVADVLDNQACVLGPRVAAFEEAMAASIGVPHAVGCASGTDAILLGLRALGVENGEEVITSPFTFFATAGAITNVGGRPVFVDIERDSFNLDCGQIEAAATDRTRAIVPVHLFGQCADMDSVMEIAERRGLGVLEDAAQSVGAKNADRQAGTMGHIGAFSFYPSKNLGGVGDGGLMTTRDEELAARLRRLRGHGGTKTYYHDEVGWNSRLDALQAVVLEVKLKHLAAWTEQRRANAAFYDEALAGLDGVRTPPAGDGMYHVYNQYMIRAERRDELRAFLGERGVGSGIYYPLSLHEQPCFADLGYKRGAFPESERACAENLSLPIHPQLRADERDYVAEQVRAFYG